MEKSSKRGKIPQADWPLIMARYEAGETLASIARTYDCSPPAISYIVSRTRERPANETPPPAAPGEPQLVKSAGAGPDADGTVLAEASTATAEAVADVRVEPQREPPSDPGARPRLQNTAPRELPLRRPAAAAPQQPEASWRTAPQANGETRQKLHLGFGNDGHAHNGTVPAPEAAGGREAPRERLPLPPQQRQSERVPQRSFGEPAQPAAAVGNGDYGFSEGRPPAQLPRGDAGGGQKSNGSFLDQELRARVDGDIGAFLAAFDALLAADTQESRFGLREATDRLLRAGARTRIELERLEARVPLATRDSAGHGELGWRYHR